MDPGLLGEEGEQGAHALVGVFEPVLLDADLNTLQLIALGVGEGLKELRAI